MSAFLSRSLPVVAVSGLLAIACGGDAQAPAPAATPAASAPAAGTAAAPAAATGGAVAIDSGIPAYAKATGVS
ncbi:MAG TPA: hypothetical protein VFO85_21335, partial [Vicinamibacteria bacterium]|nr:hypothetical protein [Vicinamibacteria bacterium]